MLFFFNTPLHRASNLRLLIRACDASIQLRNHFVGLRLSSQILQLDAAVAGVRMVESELRLSKCCNHPAAACGRPTESLEASESRNGNRNTDSTRRCSHTVSKSCYTGEQEEKQKHPEPQNICPAHRHTFPTTLSSIYLIIWHSGPRQPAHWYMCQM